jgi:hypothetical protein
MIHTTGDTLHQDSLQDEVQGSIARVKPLEHGQRNKAEENRHMDEKPIKPLLPLHILEKLRSVCKKTEADVAAVDLTLCSWSDCIEY